MIFQVFREHYKKKGCDPLEAPRKSGVPLSYVLGLLKGDRVPTAINLLKLEIS